MATFNKTTYGKLVTAIYVFYICLSLAWLLANYFIGGFVNYIVLLSLAVFCAQAYFKHRVVNLVLGLILLPASILAGLQFVYVGGKTGFDAFSNTMMLLSAISLASSIFLVFSYLKMSFSKDQP